jgi:tannase
LVYSHDGRGDQVLVQYWMPDPAKFENRYLSTGGGGYAINSGDSSQNRQICAWPLRPIWKDKNMECEYDQTSIDTWHYDLNAVPLPVY